MTSSRTNCPHCSTRIFVDPRTHSLGRDAEAFWLIQQATCPACARFFLVLESGESNPEQISGNHYGFSSVEVSRVVHPKGSGREPCPAEVPDSFAEDYGEACLVLGDSPKASAALSRRCLQAVLREKAGIKAGTLASEIETVLDSSSLPSHLSEAIDAVRNIGNFAAHPNKSHSTGEIVPVEAGEAEWNLDVLEGLFDFYFVLPERLNEKREVLNKKLADAGRPPLKSGE